MNAPILSVTDRVLRLNNTVAISDVFNVESDGGAAIQKYRFTDLSNASSSGFIRSGLDELANGSTLEIDADQLNGTIRYVAGAGISSEGLQIQAYNGIGWSDVTNIASLYSTQANVTRPEVEATTTSVLANEFILASTFVSASDPDGNPISRYFIRDENVDGKYFQLDGARLDERSFFYLEADELSRLRYYGVGAGTEDVRIFAYDGGTWSLPGFASVSTTPNLNRPVVQDTRFTFASNEVVSLESLLSYSDADLNSIKTLRVRDVSPTGDKILRNGVEQAVQEWINIDAANLDQYSYVAADGAAESRVRVQVNDGKHLSQIGDVRVTAIPLPEIELANEFVVESHLETMSLASLISTTGDVEQFQIFDANSTFGSSKLRQGPFDLQDGVVHTINAGELNSIQIQTGRFVNQGFDEFIVRGFNGFDWTAYERITVRNEPEFNTALKSQNFSDNLANDWSDWIPTSGFGQPTVISYSYMNDAPAYDYGEAEDATEFPNFPFAPFSVAQRTATAQVFDHLESLVNVEFEQVSDTSTNPFGERGGLIRFGNYRYGFPDSVTPSYSFAPNDPLEEPAGGDILINTAFLSTQDTFAGSFSYLSLVHEVGRAVGLEHSGEGLNKLPGSTDNFNFTVSSTNGRQDGVPPSSFMLYDIWTLQDLYGANLSHATGDDVYDVANFWQGNQDVVTAIWDAGGEDTLSGFGSNQGVTIDLREGQFSSLGNLDGNVSIAFNAVIENGTGSGFDDTLLGNRHDNVLSGGAGADVLKGYAGDDTLTGGFGNDTYLWDVAGDFDTIAEGQTGGRDTLQISHVISTETLDFTDDFTARREGNDLVLDLRLDGAPVTGQVRFENQGFGRHQTETIQIGSLRIDATDLFDKATPENQRFTTLNSSSIFGQLVSPV